MKLVTTFEWLSIIAYYLQLLIIGGGLRMMREAGQRRDRQLDQQAQALEKMGAGIERLLEHTK